MSKTGCFITFPMVKISLYLNLSFEKPINIMQVFVARVPAENIVLVAMDGILQGNGQPFCVSFCFSDHGWEKNKEPGIKGG